MTSIKVSSGSVAFLRVLFVRLQPGPGLPYITLTFISVHENPYLFVHGGHSFFCSFAPNRLTSPNLKLYKMEGIRSGRMARRPGHIYLYPSADWLIAVFCFLNGSARRTSSKACAGFSEQDQIGDSAQDHCDVQR